MFTGEVSEPVKKKRKTMNSAMEEAGEEQDECETEEEGNAEMYQHIKEAKKKFDSQTLDAATEVSYCVCVIIFYIYRNQHNMKLIVIFPLLCRNCSCLVS
jgi:hypothetical protein